MMSRLRRSVALVPLICTSMLVGCQSFNGDKHWFGKHDEEVVFESPSKIVSIWTNSVLRQAGSAPTRGLGGRLYFYNAGHSPIQVDGSLTVFLYDDTDPTAIEELRPTRKVTFTPEQVAKHLTPSEFGASYSFWVPWDEVGGEQAQLSVMPVFADTKGMMLAGDFAKHVLPGKKREVLAEKETKRDSSGESEVSTAEYLSQNRGGNGDEVTTASAFDTQNRKPNITSNTIKLPSTMQQRLRGGVPRRAAMSTKNRSQARAWSESRRQELDERIEQRKRELSEGQSNWSWSQPVRSEPDQPQAQVSPDGQQGHDPAPSQLDPATSPFSPPQ